MQKTGLIRFKFWAMILRTGLRILNKKEVKMGGEGVRGGQGGLCEKKEKTLFQLTYHIIRNVHTYVKNKK